MKTFRIFIRGIRDALKSVLRNFSLSLASIISVSITLFIVAMAVLLSRNVLKFTDDLESDVTMVIFVKDVSEEENKSIEDKIKAIRNVDKVRYKSKIETKNEMIEENETFKNIFKDWKDEELPLKNSFLVQVKDLKSINDTANKIKAIDGVSSVNYGEQMTHKMVNTFDLIKKAMYIMVAILVVVTILLMMNTIKLTIYSRKREIEIMRVVGASNTMIRFPFVIEGMVLGLIGTIIPIFLSLYLYSHLYNKMGGIIFSSMIRLVPPREITGVVIVPLILIALLVGIFGSGSAVRKYLKI